MNEYFEEINKNMYLTIVPTNESKEIIKRYEELWNKIRDIIRSITKNSGDHDEQDMKIKFNSNDELPLNKVIETPSMIIVACIIDNSMKIINTIHKFYVCIK